MRGLAKDPHTDIIFRDGVFHKEGINGEEITIDFGSPGTTLS